MKAEKAGAPASPPHVVGRGVDTLVVNVYYRGADDKPVKQDLAEHLKEQFESWKQQAIIAEEPIPVPVSFEGSSLHMYPNGAGKGQWRWLMMCDQINFLVSLGRFNGVAQIRLSSEFLWSCEWIFDAIVRVSAFVEDVFQVPMYLQVSEVHLCVDVAGWDVEQINHRYEFVTRSHKRGVHETLDLDVEEYRYGLHRSGLVFSRGAPMSCTIYDKTREIRQKSQKIWFYDLWENNGWESGEHPEVWRIEFRFKREALNELALPGVFSKIDDVLALPEQLPYLWAYATGSLDVDVQVKADGWLRLVVPNWQDKTRSRWETHELWKQIQQAFLLPSQETENSGVIRLRKRQVNIDRGLSATLGYLSSMAAWLGHEGRKEGESELYFMLTWLRKQTPEFLQKKGRQFNKEVLEKRVRFHQQRAYEQDFWEMASHS